ncbi:MAG: class I SAM-dependent methyltransferase [Deltaproteobacteria bacterium]|nr:class I SAM-dependent methyltransferase [Deltaproteobacteria bacterium]
MKDYTGRIVDVACGKGVLIGEVAHYGNKTVLGIDMAEDQIAVAKATGMPLVRGNIFRMPFKDMVFDVSVCLNTLYNFNSLSDLKPILKEMVRIVRLGGKIIIDIRNRKNLLLYIKYWLHMKQGKHPTVSYLPDEMEYEMRELGCRLVQYEVVGINNPYLILDYVLVFEKE